MTLVSCTGLGRMTKQGVGRLCFMTILAFRDSRRPPVYPYIEQNQLWDQTTLFRSLFSWVLKTYKDVACTASLRSLRNSVLQPIPSGSPHISKCLKISNFFLNALYHTVFITEKHLSLFQRCVFCFCLYFSLNKTTLHKPHGAYAEFSTFWLPNLLSWSEFRERKGCNSYVSVQSPLNYYISWALSYYISWAAHSKITWSISYYVSQVHCFTIIYSILKREHLYNVIKIY